MMGNAIIPYNPKLKALARLLRKQGILSEVLLWKQLQGKALGVEFHRQVPMLEYIVDFYCHELMLAIEIDGLTHDLDDVFVNDALRQKELEAYDVCFLRFRSSDVMKNMPGVVAAIQLKIEELQRLL